MLENMLKYLLGKTVAVLLLVTTYLSSAAPCTSAVQGIQRQIEEQDQTFIGAWGFIDRTGKVVIQPSFNDLRSFNAGVARVRIGREGHETIGYVDRQGRSLLEKPLNWGSLLIAIAMAPL